MQRSPYGRKRVKTSASRSHCDNIRLLSFPFEMPPGMASLQGWSHRGQNKHIYWHFRTWDIFRPGTLFFFFFFCSSSSDPGVDVLFGQLLIGLVMFDKRVSDRFGEPVSLLWAQWSRWGRWGSSSHGRDNQTSHSWKRQTTRGQSTIKETDLWLLKVNIYSTVGNIFSKWLWLNLWGPGEVLTCFF